MTTKKRTNKKKLQSQLEVKAMHHDIQHHATNVPNERPSWEGSKAQSLIREVVQAGTDRLMLPQQRWLPNEVYQVFELETFASTSVKSAAVKSSCCGLTTITTPKPSKRTVTLHFLLPSHQLENSLLLQVERVVNTTAVISRSFAMTWEFPESHRNFPCDMGKDHPT
jgi:hypothetical protein